MTALARASVESVRARIARAHEQAAARFRDLFIAGQTPPTVHLELLTDALIENAEGVRLHGRAYDIENGLMTPRYENFDVHREPEAILEYWLVISEITGSAVWRMTRLIASAEEYDDALRRMQLPRIVRAIVGSFLPSVEIADDGTALLEVTVYTRADEERIERRQLFLDEHNEFHFHGRELIAEGRGGISV